MVFEWCTQHLPQRHTQRVSHDHPTYGSTDVVKDTPVSPALSHRKES